MCFQIATSAYDAQDRHGDGVTRGGFADQVISDERFVFRIPEGLDPAAIAPLLCAGSTVYTPLKQWNAGPGMTVGVIGIGGLGHLGVKFARAWAPTSWLSRRLRPRRIWPLRWAPTRSSCPAARSRWLLRPTGSTYSWIPFPSPIR